MGQVASFLASVLVDIVNSVKQKREQKAFIEKDDFDDCFEEKEHADFLTD